MRKIFVALFIVFAVVLLTQATAGTAAAAAPYKTYCVQRGDTLSAIAYRHGITQWSLANANGIWNPNLIYVGQVLVIPAGGYCYNCGYHPGYPVKYYPKPSYGCNYWVKYGDTMIGIARRYGLDAWTLARSNGIYNLNWIYAGQRLTIPGCKWY